MTLDEQDTVWPPRSPFDGVAGGRVRQVDRQCEKN